MKTPIVDDREYNLKMLSQIEFGQHFVVDEQLYVRISTDMKVDYFEDELLVVREETGELVCMNRNRLVEPVKAEIHIVE